MPHVQLDSENQLIFSLFDDRPTIPCTFFYALPRVLTQGCCQYFKFSNKKQIVSFIYQYPIWICMSSRLFMVHFPSHYDSRPPPHVQQICRVSWASLLDIRRIENGGFERERKSIVRMPPFGITIDCRPSIPTSPQLSSLAQKIA